MVNQMRPLPLFLLVIFGFKASLLVARTTCLIGSDGQLSCFDTEKNIQETGENEELRNNELFGFPSPSSAALVSKPFEDGTIKTQSGSPNLTNLLSDIFSANITEESPMLTTDESIIDMESHQPETETSDTISITVDSTTIASQLQRCPVPYPGISHRIVRKDSVDYCIYIIDVKARLVSVTSYEEASKACNPFYGGKLASIEDKDELNALEQIAAEHEPMKFPKYNYLLGLTTEMETFEDGTSKHYIESLAENKLSRFIRENDTTLTNETLRCYYLSRIYKNGVLKSSTVQVGKCEDAFEHLVCKAHIEELPEKPRPSKKPWASDLLFALLVLVIISSVAVITYLCFTIPKSQRPESHRVLPTPLASAKTPSFSTPKTAVKKAEPKFLVSYQPESPIKVPAPTPGPSVSPLPSPRSKAPKPQKVEAEAQVDLDEKPLRPAREESESSDEFFDV